MPPKESKTAAGVDNVITGFDSKETKLLAAAFVSSIGTDKYDWELFATLTGNTVGTLKKIFPPTKRKVMEAHPSFGTFLGAGADGKPAASKGAALKADGKKRKTAPDTEDGEPNSAEGEDDATNDNDAAATKKKAPAKPRAKKAKTGEEDDAAAAADEATVDTTVKKPAAKGRPKKATTDGEDANHENANGKKPAAKGRPKKVKKEATPDDTAEAAPIGEETNGNKKKAGRGRPKKIKQEPTPDAEVAEEAENGEDQEVVPEAAVEEEA